jgi:RNA polymerase sigma-70 factor (ECF subfamily)
MHAAIQLTETLFREASASMVSVLTRILGMENLELAEDVVQQSFLEAINSWKIRGIPDKPEAWLFKVAKNKALDEIRRNKRRILKDISAEKLLLASGYTDSCAMEQYWEEDAIRDDVLRMMFACCHPGISGEYQITLILKNVCGFSTADIAKAFMVSEETVTKRLYRAKEFFRKNRVEFELPPAHLLPARISEVLNAIYLLFNEGYNSYFHPELIRADLIREAKFLCTLLTENDNTCHPAVYALKALICFHEARVPARFDSQGNIILLGDQNRQKWNSDLIAEGNDLMNAAAVGEEVSAYHIEAAIAFEHCTAKSIDETNWTLILEYYDWLCREFPSPMAALNRIAVLYRMKGPQEAIDELSSCDGHPVISKYYLFHALAGDAYSALGQIEKAGNCYREALALTHSPKEIKLIEKKINGL